MGPFYQIPGYGYLSDRVFGKGYPYGISKAVHEERTNSNGTFNSGIITISCLSYPEMKGVVHTFSSHQGDHQSISLDHHLGVTRLHGKNDLVVVMGPGDPKEFKSRFCHSTGAVSEAIHNPVGQGTVVGANSHGPAQFLAPRHQGGEFFME